MGEVIYDIPNSGLLRLLLFEEIEGEIEFNFISCCSPL